LRDASSATPLGLHKLSGPTPLASPPAAPSLHATVAKLPFWPKARSAVVSPAEPGVPGVPPPPARGSSYSSTRLLPPSATKTLPSGSTATPAGESSPSAPPPLATAVKLPPCPNTLAALCPALIPALKGAANSSTRLSTVSAT